MVEKIGPPPELAGGFVEAYYQARDHHRRRPDLRRGVYYSSGDKLLRIEFEAPGDQVLLFDLQAWMLVSSRAYIPLDLKDAEAFDEEIERCGIQKRGRRWDQAPMDLRRKMVESWDRIFDLDHTSDLTEPREEKEILAVLWKVEPEWIRDIQLFTAR